MHKELNELNESLGKYARLSSKSIEQTLLKKGTDLGFAMFFQMRGVKPAKGSIRAERLAALKRGKGVKLRDGIKKRVIRAKGVNEEGTFGKRKSKFKTVRRAGVSRRLNFQAFLVDKELSFRESSSGFLSYASKLQKIRTKIRHLKPGQKHDHLGKLNQILTTVALGLSQKEGELKVRLVNPRAAGAGEGFLKPKNYPRILAAIKETRRDMEEYVARKEIKRLVRQLKK